MAAVTDARAGGRAVRAGNAADTSMKRDEPFDPATVRSFRFAGYELGCAGSGAPSLELRYAFDLDGSTNDGERIEFTEQVVFEGGRHPEDEAGRAALERAAWLVHLIAGISYYKAAVPAEILVDTGPVPAEVAAFLERLYLFGLGEFAYRNQIDLRERIRFPSSDVSPQPLAAPVLPRRTAVPVGGGKDSIVTIEALRRAGEPMVLFSVGDPEPIREVARVAGMDRIVVTRRISPALLDLNRRGALNGHVPISAILASIMAASSVVYGFDAAALSNERSADEGNLVWNELEINHQYSKTSAFERDFGAIVERQAVPGFTYFSFLRPFSELAISALFSTEDVAYLDVFRSCNAAFRIDETRRARRWCGDCPKCRFVFLALAPFMARDRLLTVFGKDLLDDESQASGYAEMLGLEAHKPFECVGEVGECVAALAWCASSPEWRDDALVRRFAARLPALEETRRLLDEALRPGSAVSLPQRYRAMLPSVPVARDA